MCGIAGIFLANRFGCDENVIKNMTNAIKHRGPDDSGYWFDVNTGLMLGHCRLSILDISCAGHQPMHSKCSRFVLVFNGEIYNHQELRKILKKTNKSSTWRGHSDTETILACFSEWGIKKTLESAVGMFALALWDREHECLTLARDRFGEKPLYYGFIEGSFAFASELKALAQVPNFSGEINRDALALMMRYNNIPDPYCIYKGLFKLPPGAFIQITHVNLRSHNLSQVFHYWSANEIVEQSQFTPLCFYSDKAATDALEQILADSIYRQMLSDVPLGAFLSGGIDSSTVVALMQAQSSLPVKTFTIGFNESDHNEAEYAKRVANHLGTDHTELYVRSEDALAIIPRLPMIYDEPFADSSQLPTFLVAELTRRHVTVALSGDGGDELFAGYNRYTLAARKWKYISSLPLFLRKGLAVSLKAFSPIFWNLLDKITKPMIPVRLRLNELPLKVQKTAIALTANDETDLYRRLVSHWDPRNIVLRSEEPNNAFASQVQITNLAEKMMVYDTLSYLPGDILVKVDRAAMANSLETRIPFLDHEVFEFAWRLPFSYKIRNGVGKWLLRQVLYRYVPQKLVERPKAGFGIPLSVWLRGPLRDWAEEQINETRLTNEGYLNPTIVRQYWNDHIKGRHNWHHQLWCVLMFQSWLHANHA